MSDNLKTASDLSFAECGALLTLGSRGASASFDLEAMSHLFADGMIEVSNVNRRVKLTPQGDIAYAHLAGHLIPDADSIGGIERVRTVLEMLR